jgi:hypothetical protein
LEIGKGHDDSKRRIDLTVPVEDTSLRVKVGDSYDQAEVDAIMRVQATTSGVNSSDGVQRSSGAVAVADSYHSATVRALLLIVAGVALASTYSIIAYQLPIALVPIVLLVSIGALYLFALFLVPPSNSQGVRSFGTVLKALIAAAFLKENPGISKQAHE